MKYILFAFLLGLLLGFLKYVVKPIIKGIVGEKVISVLLSGLPKEQYILLNDVMLQTDKGTTQVDHILVSVYGIFVIETKNYKGWIYGGEYAEQWTQNIYGNKSKFLNPLRQNYGHIVSLMQLLNLPKEAFIPIVAFAGTATLKIKSKQPVIYFTDIKKVVLQYQNKRFSEEEIVKLAEAISSGKMDGSLVERVQHVKNIKENISVDREKVMNNVCPKCGGQLTQKKGKYGAFIGCRNYPECRYTMKV